MIDVTISTLFYGKPEISQKFLQMLKNTLQDREDVEVIIRNNGMIDGEQSTNLVLNSGIKNVRYIPSGVNLGFPQGHNLNLQYAQGLFFIILNNDLFFSDNKWIEKLLAALKEGSDPSLKLIGLQGAPCDLVYFSNGHIGGKVGSRLDYLEGSCIAGFTEDFKQYGLFDDAYEMGFFEDGDLCLRFKQMGFKISTVKIAHQHMRSQSLSQIPQADRDRFISHNCEIFKKRWSRYLSNRAFSNVIEIKIESLGIGDVLCATPVVEAIRRAHPLSILEITTSCPEIFFNNPHISELYQTKRERKKVYDRVIELAGPTSKPEYWGRNLIAQDSEAMAAVKLDSYLPQLFMTQEELNEGLGVVNSLKEDGDETVVGVQLQNHRKNWEGKCYSLENSRNLIRLLQEAGARVIELGQGVESTGVADIDLIDKTDLRQFFSMIAAVDMFIGIDSLGLHISQAFGTLAFILFGATHWAKYIIDYRTVFPVFREDLVCYGCYQRKNKDTLNQCAIKNQECMDIAPENIMEIVLTSKEELLARNLRLLQDYMRTYMKVKG